jgi:hypothetical protein
LKNARLFPWLAIALVLFAGCINIGTNSKSSDKTTTTQTTIKTSPVGTGTLKSGLDFSKDYSYGSIETNDDSIILSCKPEGVASGVSLEKRIAYYKKDSGSYSGETLLRFKSSGAKDFHYVGTFSKDFASDVKFLKFSIQPDEIIQADPVVSWSKSVDGSLDIIVSSAEEKNAAEAKTVTEDALVDGSLAACERLSDEERIVCALEVARKYRDSSIIKKYAQALDRYKTEGALIGAIINKDSDKYCNRLTDVEQIRICRKYAFASFVKDCEDGPSDAKADCIRKNLWLVNEHQGIMESCEYITDIQLKAECMGTVDASYCEGIADKGLSSKCMFHLARVKGDAMLCKKVSDPELRDLCNQRLSEVKGDISICRDIKDEDIRDECVSTLAATKGDIKICDEIKSEEHKGACLTGTALLSALANKTDYLQDTSICDKIKENQEMKDLCYTMVAARTINPALCDKVVDEDSRDICFLVFFVTNDSSYCDKIKNEMMRDECVKLVAENAGDAQMCENIDDPQIKAECEKALGKTTTTTNPKTSAAAGTQDCPTGIPAGAIRMEGSPYGKPEVWYRLNEKTVGPDIIYADSTKTKMAVQKCFDLDGKEDGLMIAWDASGTKEWERHYSHGLLDGPSREWRQGVIYSEGSYKAGKLDGLWKGYSDGGVLSSEQNYKAGKFDGTQKYYYSSGQLKREETYANGEWAGYRIEYTSDGKKETEWKGTVSGGKFSGTYIDWYRNTECRSVNDVLENCGYMS